MVSHEDIIFAYRLFLGRYPESEAAVAAHAAAPDLRALYDLFLASEEFKSTRVAHLPASLDEAPPLEIDVDVNPDVLQRMFARVEETWRHVGTTEPFWSVLSSDAFKQNRFEENATRFYDSGQKEFARLLAWIRRSYPDFQAEGRSCCEYGCGTGRVTRFLASHFQQVIACDISKPHLDLARDYLHRAGAESNVLFRQIDSLETLKHIEPVDVVLSCIVLQHNPPPVMAFIVNNMMQWVKPGGFAFFQIPTYCLNYRFIAADYLEIPSTRQIEMHVLPQKYVHAIARRHNCSVLEVQPDRCVGLAGWISSTFLIQKDYACAGISRALSD